MSSVQSCILLLMLCFGLNTAQNGTDTRDRQAEHRESQLLSVIRHIQLQLTSLDTDIQRQGGRIDDMIKTSTRIEAQRQDLITTLDRSESRILQSLEDIKSESRRFITLQDVIREDIEKVKENQVLHRAWLEEKIREINTAILRANSVSDEKTNSTGIILPGDILSGDIRRGNTLQAFWPTISSLRRMVGNLQSENKILKRNMTYLMNMTQTMMEYEQQSLLSKNYFESVLQMQLDQQSNIHITHCFNSNQTEILPEDCSDVQRQTSNKSGVYRIRLKYSVEPIFVYCDMETEGGGWTVFQRRIDGTVDFLRNWQEYKHGFGNVGGEYWLGNENLHLLSHQNSYELRVDLEDFEGGAAHSKYSAFAVGGEREKYKLKLLGSFAGGDAGDGLTYHAGMAFSTIDIDNDPWVGGHCAVDHAGGWWYNQCDVSNLNGKYLRGINPYEYQGMYWHEWQGPSYSLKSSKMMIRPRQLSGSGPGS